MSNLSSFPTEEPKTTKQKILEAGANLLQSKEPIKSFKQHLMSVSQIAGDPSKQYIFHHFVNAFNEDFAQALLYDGELVDSKLVGIQYIVSDKVYLTLPEEEKKLWHPLQYMVKNGLLVAPSLPSMAEKPLMTRLLTSYSKTFLFWQTALNPLPLGIPQILSSFTTDGQANKTLSTNLLEAAEIKLADLIKRRENIDQPTLLGGVDHSRGEIYQLFLQKVGGPHNQNQVGGLGSNYQTGITGNTGAYGYEHTPGLGGATGTYGTAGAPGAYGASGLTGTSTPLTGTTYGTTTPLTGTTYGATTPLTGTSGLTSTHGTTAPLIGTSGLTGTHGTTTPYGTPVTGTTGLTGVNQPISHQTAVENVAAGLLGGEHGHTPKRDTLPLQPGATTTYPYHAPTSTDYTSQ